MWFTFAALLLFAWFGWQLFGPSPPIRIADETTYIMEPLRPDGLPDYVSHLRDKLRDGVTQENNAAVLMWQAFGPQGADDDIEANWQLVTRELKLPPIDTSKCLVDPYSNEMVQRVGKWFISSNPEWKQAFEQEPPIEYRDSLPTELGYDVIGEAQSSPWRREQLPHLAEWLDANDHAIELLLEASRRPRYYTPFDLAEPDDEDLLVAQLPMNGIMRARQSARVLSIRAMSRLGDGQHQEAWQDLLAIHRWARLVGQGPTIVEQLVAIAIDGIACQADAVLLSSDGLPADVAEQIHRDLRNLAPAANISRSFIEGERLYFLDSIVNYREQGIGTFVTENFRFDLDTREPKEPDWTTSLLNLVSVDWNVGMEQGNLWFDRLAAAASLPNYIDRQQEFRRLIAELGSRDESLRKPTNWLYSTTSVDNRSEMLATAMIAALSPTLYATLEAQDRAMATLELTNLAAALAVYRAKNGEYPERLDQLVPSVIPQPPFDLYHSKPFVYQRDGEGYLLYSTGPNGVDDGGSNSRYGGGILAGRELEWNDDDDIEKLRQQIPAGADDLAIRLPRPTFQLPTPPVQP